MLSHSARLRQRIHEAFAASSAAMYPARGTRPLHAEPIHGSGATPPNTQLARTFGARQMGPHVMLSPEEQRVADELDGIVLRESAFQSGDRASRSEKRTSRIVGKSGAFEPTDQEQKYPVVLVRPELSSVERETLTQELDEVTRSINEVAVTRQEEMISNRGDDLPMSEFERIQLDVASGRISEQEGERRQRELTAAHVQRLQSRELAERLRALDEAERRELEAEARALAEEQFADPPEYYFERLEIQRHSRIWADGEWERFEAEQREYYVDRLTQVELRRLMRSREGTVSPQREVLEAYSDNNRLLLERELGPWAGSFWELLLDTRATINLQTAVEMAQRAHDVGRTYEEILQDEVERYGATSYDELVRRDPMGYHGFARAATEAALLRYENIRWDGEAERQEYIRQGTMALVSTRALLVRASMIGMSDNARRFRDGTLANADDSTMGFLGAIRENPMGAAAFIAESSAESLPMLAATAIATNLTGPIGGMAIMGGGTFLQENAEAALEWLANNNIDISTPEAAALVIGDFELFQQAHRHGVSHGLIVATFNAMAVGVGGINFVSAPLGNLAVQALVRTFLRSAGEMAAELLPGAAQR